MLENRMSRDVGVEDALSVSEIAAVSPAPEPYGKRRLVGDLARDVFGKRHKRK